MLSVKEYLIASGLDYEPNDIKLVKHVNDSAGNWNIEELTKSDAFDYFQAVQGYRKHPFHNCKVIVTFIAIGNNLAKLWGVYCVNGYRDFTRADFNKKPPILQMKTVRSPSGEKRLWYDLKELSDFNVLRNRMIITWKSTRGWVQKKDLDIYELLPPIEVIPFPGYQDVFLTFDELKQIINNPRAHKDWKAALQANAGIYRIVDMSNGEIYIGSAYGNDGLWGRWCNYAKSGHGGNKLLKNRDPSNFNWSIVRTLSRSMSQHDVIKIESMEKIKHGSRVHGLNHN